MAQPNLMEWQSCSIPHSNRSMLLRLEAKPQNINIIQVYAPTADKPQNELDEFYAEVRNLLQYTKKHDINIIMGDLNAKVGAGEVPGVIGPYGLGVRNERGEALIEFCQEHELVVTNTLFKHHPRRLYTWTSPAHTPDHIVRNQIDYIAINSRFKNSIKSAQTYPGADINSDHNPVIVKMCCNLKKLKKTKIICRPDIRSIKHPDKRVKVSKAINRWAEENFNTTASVEEVNHALVRTITDINETILGQTQYNKRQQWMEDEILDLMEERRLIKQFYPHTLP
ncbi:craniofacial development protein 2-like [Pieris napi]|uniref:craniofacial development protein 2-like n=1 Tax=Pieris napi TaxID=78633 RepID=UPI001FB90A7E|nr:craniofacial development protein 2-like [Pieris napi]